MSDTLRTILDSGVVAVIRSDVSAGLLEAARALAAGGVRAIEVTMTTPGAVEAITALAAESRGEFAVGAGTVLDADAARRVIDAGAEFLVSPNLDVEMIRVARAAGKVVCPGALSPTEILTAWQAGADLVKVFPVSCVGGPAYIKAVRAPLPQVRLMAVGGVEAATAGSYIAAGAAAVGLGQSLINTRLIKEAAWDRITETARRCVEAVAQARLQQQGTAP
jgi:2-dehydro-3-deoxyphosphogluconate aldolase/(4S)-4-hydroxy-2-oxoglutarate aldolase